MSDSLPDLTSRQRDLLDVIVGNGGVLHEDAYLVLRRRAWGRAGISTVARALQRKGCLDYHLESGRFTVTSLGKRAANA